MRSFLAALLTMILSCSVQAQPAVGTAAANDNSTKAASTAFVRGLRGAANGLAALDGSGRLPTAQLPSFVNMTVTNTNVTNAMANTLFGVATDSGYNAITGAGVTRFGNTFPTAVYGYWEMPLAGGTGYSLNGICVLKASGSCFAEIDARNNSGPPPTTQPGNPSFGTSDNLSIALHLGAGGTYQPLTGLSIGTDGGAPSRFVDGIYMHKDGDGPSGHGLFVDASSASGPAVSALLRNTGQGSNIPLVLQTMGTAVAANPVLQHLNAAGAATWSINQAGGATFSGTVTAPTPAANDNSTAVATTAYLGAAWTAYTPTISATSGSFTTATSAGRYRLTGKTLIISVKIDVATNGSAAGLILASLPNTSAGQNQVVSGVEYNSNKSLSGRINANSANLAIQNTDGSYAGGNGTSLVLTGVLEVQ